MIVLFFAGITTLVTRALRFYRDASDGEERFLFVLGCLYKSIFGIFFGSIYWFYYSEGDTLLHFELAARLSKEIYSRPIEIISILVTDFSWLTGEPRTDFFIRITSVFSLFSMNNYWIITLYLSLFSFFAWWQLIQCLEEEFRLPRVKVFIAAILLPSVAFFSSGMIKESLSSIFMAWCVIAAVRIKSISWTSFLHLTILIISGLLLWKLKYYQVAVFIPLLVAMIIYHRLTNVPAKLKLLYSSVIVIFIVTIISVFGHYNLHPFRLWTTIVNNHNLYLMNGDMDNMIHYYDLSIGFRSFIFNWPVALFSGIYRPFLWESWNTVSLLLSVEKLLLLILTIWSIKYWIRTWPRVNQPVVIIVCIYVLIMASFLALSTPNFGTLARYNVSYLPFFLFLLLYPIPMKSFRSF